MTDYVSEEISTLTDLQTRRVEYSRNGPEMGWPLVDSWHFDRNVNVNLRLNRSVVVEKNVSIWLTNHRLYCIVKKNRYTKNKLRTRRKLFGNHCSAVKYSTDGRR